MLQDVEHRGWVETIIITSWFEDPGDTIGRTILHSSLDVKARIQCIYYGAEGRQRERGRERVWVSGRVKHDTRCTEGRRIDEGTDEKNEVATINYNLLVSRNVGVGYIIRRVKLADHMRILERGKRRHDQEDW